MRRVANVRRDYCIACGTRVVTETLKGLKKFMKREKFYSYNMNINMNNIFISIIN